MKTFQICFIMCHISKDIITAHVTTELIITMDQIQWINL